MIVVPVTAAVTAAVWIFAPPIPFGTCSSITPLSSDMFRVPSTKLKCVFAPSRVIVWSLKSSSLRDSTPVRTLCCPRSVSLMLAGCAPFDGSTVFTSFTICVIFAWVSVAAWAKPGTASAVMTASRSLCSCFIILESVLE